jgi:hypothetical protein
MGDEAVGTGEAKYGDARDVDDDDAGANEKVEDDDDEDEVERSDTALERVVVGAGAEEGKLIPPRSPCAVRG